MAAENHISRTTDDKVAFKQDNDTTCPVPSTSRNGKLNISTSEEKRPSKCTKLETSSTYSLQRPLPLMNKAWYKR